MNKLHIIHGASIAILIAGAALTEPVLILPMLFTLFIGFSIGMSFFARFK